MTTHHRSFRQLTRYAALVAALAAHPAMAQEVSLGRDCIPQLTSMQQRLYQKASEGPDALRHFIFIRRAILQVDIYETAIWAVSVSRAHVSCMKKASDT